jgi:UDP-N-acetylglucosamine--N-acetylmuramyl-(pentapeptide) pyrophosphoryl-undecaprenol N-acetylglucosamine transferase
VSRPVLMIAGGGTGGHVFPAVAVAEAVQRLDDVDIVFVGTARGVEARVVPAGGWRLELLDIEPMKGGGWTKALRAAIVATRATRTALGIVRRTAPRAVLSVGGYASGPAALAAAILGVPVAVLEPNSTVGLANRLLAPFAKCAFLAWEDAAPRFRAAAVRQYGVPLRAGFSPTPCASGRPAARILVMGGSQGAAALNERLPEAVARLKLRGRSVEVLHQAGRGRDGAVRDAYASAKVERATVVAFIDDVAHAIADADLVIARAGAGTIAEITAIGRPSILVPFPRAADDHQAKNAEALARAGVSVCLRQEAAGAERLAAEIERLFADDAARAAMADVARLRGRPDAARYTAIDLLSLASLGRRGRPARFAQTEPPVKRPN